MLAQRGAIRIGDTARFPLGKLGDENVYRHRWMATAFLAHGNIQARRLADGIEKTVSPFWWEKYRTEENSRLYIADDASQERKDRKRAGLERIRQQPIANAQHQTDSTKAGYYVSAVKGKRYVLLLGPFCDHYSAIQLVPIAERIARRYADPFNEIAYGTCRCETSERIGKFNSEVFGE